MLQTQPAQGSTALSARSKLLWPPEALIPVQQHTGNPQAGSEQGGSDTQQCTYISAQEALELH